MLALQRSIGNAATSRMLSTQGRALQRQRDLQVGAPVEFTSEAVTRWGTVNHLEQGEGAINYVVANDGTGEVTTRVPPHRLKPVNVGEKLEVGTSVIAQPWRQEFRATITAVVRDPPPQFYDIWVEWEEGWQVPQRYLERGVPEPDVRAKARNEFQPRAPRTATSVQVEHFHPASQANPNAAEYVKPGGPIDITSHALGSGMYGVAEATEDILEAAEEHGAFTRTPIQINDPLVVQNELHGQELQSLNKRINEIAQELENAQTRGQGHIDAAVQGKAVMLQDLLNRVFGRAGLQVPQLDKVKEALATFFQRYQAHNAKFVDQPATIFLAELCHLGGIYGDESSGLNSYQKGSVKFLPPNQDAPRKTRTGTAHEFVLM